MTEPKQVRVEDFLSVEQAHAMLHIWFADRNNFHKRVIAEVLEPNMAEINRKLGQENSIAFLAYALEYACSEASKKRGE